MFRLRIKYEKKEWAKFVSQLEMVKVLERTLRRAEFPLAFTEGFSLRPKLSFGPPTPVGFESETEFVDVILVNYLPEVVAMRRLENFFPEGFKPLSTRYVSLEEVSLVKRVSFSEYEVFLPLPRVRSSVFLEKIKSYLETVSEISHRGRLIKINRETDFPEFSVFLSEGKILLRLILATRGDKTVRPDILILPFLEQEEIPFSSLRFLRKALFFWGNGQLKKLI